jgi:hypothetical protein
MPLGGASYLALGEEVRILVAHAAHLLASEDHQLIPQRSGEREFRPRKIIEVHAGRVREPPSRDLMRPGLLARAGRTSYSAAVR